jgi:hypothetical protein
VTLIYSVGLGVDSTAALILAAQQGVNPAAIIFADTGGEKPETYHFKGILEKWIQDTFSQPLITVRNQRTRAGVVCNTLEEHCLAGHKLPSIVYGKKACSLDWKKKPVLKWCKENLPPPYIFAISYNADERRRAIPDSTKIYPLIDAGWGRLECLTAIARSPLPMPCKSACFFCPSSKKREVLDLARIHPDLAARAIAMEKNDTASNPETVQGLGRQWSWSEIIESRGGDQPSLFESAPRDCSCVEAGVTIAEYWKQF